MSALYMAVTPDEYELPLMVCCSVKELSSKTGIKGNAIYYSIYNNAKRAKTGDGEYVRIRKVEVDESEDK
jgi:hypothetical protein